MLDDAYATKVSGPHQNPYDDLGVANDATDGDIASSYRKLARQAHPDRLGGSDEAMKRINGAYDRLRTPEARAKTDALLDAFAKKTTVTDGAGAAPRSPFESLMAEARRKEEAKTVEQRQFEKQEAARRKAISDASVAAFRAASAALGKKV